MKKEKFYTRLHNDIVGRVLAEVDGYTTSFLDFNKNEIRLGAYKTTYGDWQVIELSTGMSAIFATKTIKEGFLETQNSLIKAADGDVKGFLSRLPKLSDLDDKKVVYGQIGN